MPYIPAILITLYDGYYIYSPSEYSYATKEANENGQLVEQQKTGYTHILKPYVYYSARYESGSDYVVVNYSLDNYITIYGTINNKVISNAGYLEDEETLNNIDTTNGESLSETITYRYDNKSKFNTITCKFINENGKRLYNIKNGKGVEDGWYYLNDLDLVKYTGDIQNFNLDNSAKEYKESAIKFNNWIKENTGLKNIVRPENAVKTDGTKYAEFAGDSTQILITNPEDLESAFNQHKRQIIQISIQDNLNNAIAIYNANSGAMGTNATFRMPKLNELDWDKILTNVNIVTFMQGLPVGNKIFNSYAIVTSTNNKQYISPNSIYIIDNNSQTYHALNCDELNNANSLIGYKSADFVKVKYEYKDENGENAYRYYYKRPEYACYSCLVDTTNFELDLKNINSNVKRAYYTALARERYNLDKVTKLLINYNT